LPRQREQQVERAFIALDVDDQRRLAIRKVGRPPRLEGQNLSVHPPPPNRPISASSSALAAARSNGCAGLRAASARSARINAWPDNSGASRATCCISSSLPLQCRIMSHPADI